MSSGRAGEVSPSVWLVLRAYMWGCVYGMPFGKVGTKLGKWCVLLELVARDFWRMYCRYDEGIRLFVK